MMCKCLCHKIEERMRSSLNGTRVVNHCHCYLLLELHRRGGNIDLAAAQNHETRLKALEARV